ncbi:MAG: WD40 repeat domain-containing protein, partial [Opitutaceae bacterium]
LLTTGNDGFSRLWDVDAEAMVTEPALQQNSKLFAAQSPDGRHVVIGTATGNVHLFSIGHGRPRPLIVPRSANPTVFLRDAPSRLLWMGVDRARVLDAATGHWIGNGFRFPEPVLPNGPNDFSPPLRADQKFFVARNRSQQWQAWELGPEGVRHVIRLEDAPASDGYVLFHPRADVVALVTARAGGGLMGLWNLHTGARTAPAFRHPEGVVFLSANFSPDGHRLALGALDGVGIILEADTLKPWGILETRPLSPVHEARFSPRGSPLVTINTRSEMQLWDPLTRQAIGPVRLSLRDLRVRFSDDGRRFATWSGSGQTINIWDGQTGEPIGDTIPTSGKHVRFSPDGERLSTAGDDGNAQVWDVHTGLPITERMSQGASRMLLAEFSPDGRFVQTVGGLLAAPNVPALGVWTVPPPLPKGAATPEWLLQLATVFANKTINEAEQCVEDSSAVKKIAELRRQIAALPSDAPLAEWGRWILNDRADRSIAPGFSITPTEAEKFTADLVAQMKASNP